VVLEGKGNGKTNERDAHRFYQMERGVSSSGAAPNGSFDRMESSYYLDFKF
jgi:hypothetical protein